MNSFVSIVQYEGGLASYLIQNTKDENFSARLIRSTANIQIPGEMVIRKNLFLKKGDSKEVVLRNKLVSAIKSTQAIEQDSSLNFIN